MMSCFNWAELVDFILSDRGTVLIATVVDAMGKMLERVAAEHPDNRILVLCGHTHSPGVYRHTTNLRVLTGKAIYGAPVIGGVAHLDLPPFEP